jgi:hypothetical protein
MNIRARRLIWFCCFLPAIGLSQIDTTAEKTGPSTNRFFFFRLLYDNDFFNATDRYYMQEIGVELIASFLKKIHFLYLSPEFKGGLSHGWGHCVITFCF